MNIRIEGLENLVKLWGGWDAQMESFVSDALWKAGAYAISKARNYPFIHPTGNLNEHYTELQVTPTSLAMFSSANYWRWVEWGSGIYSELGAGRQTPWVYYGRGGWEGFHYTHGQKAKHMLLNATTGNIHEIQLTFLNTIKEHMIRGA